MCGSHSDVPPCTHPTLYVPKIVHAPHFIQLSLCMTGLYAVSGWFSFPSDGQLQGGGGGGGIVCEGGGSVNGDSQ